MRYKYIFLSLTKVKMKEKFKNIIIEKQEWVKNILPIHREVKIEKKANYVFTGLRRAGKSYVLYQMIREKLDLDNFDRLIFINFEDERLLEVTSHDLHLIIDAYKELYDLEPIICLDEIQNIHNWQKFVRRLADEGYQIYVTGSNADMLSHEIATTLGGRFVNKEILPLSFKEYLRFHQIEVNAKLKYASNRIKIFKLYEDYLHHGGFPELIHFENKRDYLSSVYQKLFYGDLIARYKVSSVITLKLMVKKIAESVNNETSINRIKNLIKSTGVSIGSNTLFDYLNYLESSYMIASISNYYSKFSEKESIKKYYFLDTGLLNLFLTNQPTKLLENQIYIELRRRGESIFFLKQKNEVDFYLPDQSTLIQVSYSINDPETATREIKGLKTAMKSLHVSLAYIITVDETKDIEIEEGLIKVVPAWQWLLKL
jgi:predicted AAA+ superfamily ATPase